MKPYAGCKSGSLGSWRTGHSCPAVGTNCSAARDARWRRLNRSAGLGEPGGRGGLNGHPARHAGFCFIREPSAWVGGGMHGSPSAFYGTTAYLLPLSPHVAREPHEEREAVGSHQIAGRLGGTPRRCLVGERHKSFGLNSLQTNGPRGLFGRCRLRRSDCIIEPTPAWSRWPQVHKSLPRKCPFSCSVASRKSWGVSTESEKSRG